MNEDVSVAAAILTAEFIRKGDVKEGDAYLLWRRLRTRMQAEIGRDGATAQAARPASEGQSSFMGGAA